MKRLLIIIIMILGLNGIVYSAFSSKSAGTRGAAFLKIGVGARGAALSDTQAALTDDVNSMYYNPAGLNSITRKEISFMHCAWFEAITYEEVAYAQSVSSGVVGVMINYLTMDAIQKYDNTGALVNETYSPKDLALTLSYARIYKDIPIGASIKYISSKIENESASALAIDLGAKYKLEKYNVMLGCAMQNLGTKLKYINEGVGLPFNIRFGGAYEKNIYKGLLKVALDINAYVDEPMKLSVGAEYNYKFEGKVDVMLSPRLGLRTDKSELEGLNVITGGLGINYKDYDLDYAWAPYGELGSTHRISLIMRFDRLFPKKKKETKEEEKPAEGEEPKEEVKPEEDKKKEEKVKKSEEEKKEIEEEIENPFEEMTEKEILKLQKKEDKERKKLEKKALKENQKKEQEELKALKKKNKQEKARLKKLLREEEK